MKKTIKRVLVYLYKKKAKNVLFFSGSSISKDCKFESMNALGERSKLNNCYVGFGTYIGRDNELFSVKIGRFCSIGSFVINTTGRHPSSTFVSTHPAFFSSGKARGFTYVKDTIFSQLKYAEPNYLVTIGNDVWIGDKVTILDGVKIGDGAIIGACSLVTKDIDPYTINVGVPAKPIKKRFTEEQILFLLQLKWWNKGEEWLKKNAILFKDIDIFINDLDEN